MEVCLPGLQVTGYVDELGTGFRRFVGAQKPTVFAESIKGFQKDSERGIGNVTGQVNVEAVFPVPSADRSGFDMGQIEIQSYE